MKSWNSVAALVIVFLLGTCAAWGNDSAPVTLDYLGRWNIKIHETGDTFQTAWLKIEERDGGLGGALVWKWGSVEPLSEVAIDGDGVRFRRRNEQYAAKIVGHELHGTAKLANDKDFQFVGWRADEMCDATGTWLVRAASRPDAEPGKLVLEQRDGKVTGKAYDPQGNAYEVRDSTLDGYRLSIKSVPIDVVNAPPRKIDCELRGDTLVGQVIVPASDDREEMTIAVEGKRQREWAEPVHLLQENSLEGWGPRDPEKKFGWKVEDGVLENQPPDVDIMSEAKFRDFHLHLQYKVNPGSNSGVYLRGRYELQILGSTRVEDHGNMAVYSRLKPKKNPLKPGDWNTLEVTFIGRWVTVVLNGETVHDNQYLEGSTGGAWDPREEQPGPLLLQGDHGKVWFRDIIVTPVK